MALDTATERIDWRAEYDLGTRPRQRLALWGWFWAGLAIGGSLVYFAASRPVARELGAMQNQMLVLERGMKKLTGQSESARRTTDLLSVLTDQGKLAENASLALDSIQALNSELASQTEELVQARKAVSQYRALQEELLSREAELPAATVALDRMGALQRRLLVEHGLTAQADRSLASLGALRDRALELECDSAAISDGLDALSDVHDRVVEEHGKLIWIRETLAELARLEQDAVACADDLGAARASLEALASLKSQALALADPLRQSEMTLDDMARLNDRIVNASIGVAEARQVSDQLLGMKDEILLRGTNPLRPEAARFALEGMIEIRERLDAQTNLPSASSKLGGLIELKDRVVAQTGDLASAIETLEVSSDLRREFDAVVESFERIRRWMTEIAVLETTVDRTVTALRPLAELGNLRRLSATELRQAARVVAEERTSRTADASAGEGRGTALDAVDQD